MKQPIVDTAAIKKACVIIEVFALAVVKAANQVVADMPRGDADGNALHFNCQLIDAANKVSYAALSISRLAITLSDIFDVLQ